MNKWTEAGIENLKLRVSIVLGEKFHTCKQSLMECSVLDWGFKGMTNNYTELIKSIFFWHLSRIETCFRSIVLIAILFKAFCATEHKECKYFNSMQSLNSKLFFWNIYYNLSKMDIRASKSEFYFICSLIKLYESGALIS